jgi:hypothetical protein
MVEIRPFKGEGRAPVRRRDPAALDPPPKTAVRRQSVGDAPAGASSMPQSVSVQQAPMIAPERPRAATPPSPQARDMRTHAALANLISARRRSKSTPPKAANWTPCRRPIGAVAARREKDENAAPGERQSLANCASPRLFRLASLVTSRREARARAKTSANSIGQPSRNRAKAPERGGSSAAAKHG